MRSLILLALVVFIASRWVDSDRREGEADVDRIGRLITPAEAVPMRDGVAAVVLVDVSGSMGDQVVGAEGRPVPKIDVARRAAFDLVGQFDRYAASHPDEPVLVGIYEFSERGGPFTREVIPLSQPDLSRARQAIDGMVADGGTPIGDALVEGQLALDRTGLNRRHLLVVTDGENTVGYHPQDVVTAIMRRPEMDRPSVYFVAFDISASRFDTVRDAGGLVLAAADATELNETLDTLLTGRILVEGQ